MNRIDVSSLYTHIVWSLWFLVYMMTSIYGIYIICTDLKGFKGAKEDFIMALLVFLWAALAYTLWAATERFA